MTILANNISGFIPSQVPQYILDQYPNFVAVLQAYFKFLEDTNYNGTIFQIRNLLANNDVDTAESQFLQFFQNDFLPYFPQNPTLDLRKLLKVATKFYQTKGTQNSIEFLFRVLYGLDSQIFYPKQNILKLSDGKWQLPQSVKLVLVGNSTTFDIAQLVGRQGVGSQSFSTCVIESVNLTIDPTLNREVVECFLSSVSAPFTPGEQLIVNCGNDSFGNPIIFANQIAASISGVTIDPNNPGLKYKGTTYYGNGSINYQGDPVSIIGGLANANDIIQAVAYVGNVTQGSITGLSVQDGGYGFRLDPNTIVSIVNAPGDTTGGGANIIVDGVDTGNQVFLLLNTDSIFFKQNVVIGNTTYQFANNTSANLLSVLGNTFTFANLAVAPISSMNVVYGGSSYTGVPTLNLTSVFDTDYSRSLYAVWVANPTPANWTIYQTAKSRLKDIGRIAAVEVISGGSGYSNVTDKIYMDTAVGYGAGFTFITNGSGGITKVIVANSGFGFSHPMATAFLANSVNSSNASAGSGAVLAAYGDSEDVVASLSVSSIGRILDFRMVNRGFDYVSTPLVSLRNEDVKITPILSNQFYFQGEQVFQGANANAATFTAFVDEYDRANNILRLYNYVGAINVAATLQGANQNASPISVTIYGNGKARANAQFFGGLIKYPGFWLSTDGFLSADQYLEDETTYHNYSYIIKVEKELAAYSDTIQKIAHPAGMKMLGLMTVTDNKTDIIGLEAETIQTMNTANVTGNITTNAFSSGNGLVTGLSTHFVGNVSINDILLISSNTSRQQTKVVTGIINNTALYIESNTMYFSFEKLKTTTGSNVVISTTPSTNVGVGDTLRTNIAGNAQTSLVAAVALGGNTITVNTVFSSNNTNVEFQAWPIEANVAYAWYTPA